MVVKEMAQEVLDALPEGASMDDLIHALYVRAKFERGAEEIRQGRGVSHEEACQRLRKWVK